MPLDEPLVWSYWLDWLLFSSKNVQLVLLLLSFGGISSVMYLDGTRKSTSLVLRLFPEIQSYSTSSTDLDVRRFI